MTTLAGYDDRLGRAGYPRLTECFHIEPFADGYVLKEPFRAAEWITIGWYRTIPGAKRAAARYAGTSLRWEERS